MVQLVVVVGAVILAQSLSILGIPQQIIETIQNFGINKYFVFALIILTYLVLGCLFDGLSLMMTLPIVFPLMINLDLINLVRGCNHRDDRNWTNYSSCWIKSICSCGGN